MAISVAKGKILVLLVVILKLFYVSETWKIQDDYLENKEENAKLSKRKNWH